jgi:hypothetical protein
MEPASRNNRKVLGHIRKLRRAFVRGVRRMDELRDHYETAERAGVDGKDVEHVGYDGEADPRHTRPEWRDYRERIRPVPNFVITKKGRRIDVPIDWKAELETLLARKPKPKGRQR